MTPLAAGSAYPLNGLALLARFAFERTASPLWEGWVESAEAAFVSAVLPFSAVA